MKKQRFIPWGRTLTTKDNYLGKQKTKSCKTRPVVVIDNNGYDLGVVPLSSRDGANRTELKDYNKTFGDKKAKSKVKTTYYKHYFEIEDDEGHPIRINDKFRENHKNMDIPKTKVDEIRSTIFSKAKTQQRNKKLYNKFHNK